MQLDHRIREFIAVGAAVGANCHSCLQFHLTKARELGIAEDELAQATEVGKLVRKGAQGAIDKLACNLLREPHTAATAAGTDSGCGCGQ